MNQYERQNAAFKIDGYYNPPKLTEDVAAAFEQARALCLTAIRKGLDDLERMTVAEFLAGRKGK